MDSSFVYPEILNVRETISEELERCSFFFLSYSFFPSFSCCMDTAHKPMKPVQFEKIYEISIGVENKTPILEKRDG